MRRGKNGWIIVGGATCVVLLTPVVAIWAMRHRRSRAWSSASCWRCCRHSRVLRPMPPPRCAPECRALLREEIAMLATPHLVTGAAIGKVLKRPALAWPVAFASYFLLDHVPHLD